jgi:tetratricopeptide (TPR) repeat protein
LDEINQAIRRIALDLNHRMKNFQQGAATDPDNSQLLALKNLHNCVQSAATVVSSASTILGVEDVDQFSVINRSEFGDIFSSEPGETMRRWISSKTVSEFEEDRVGESSSKRRNIASDYRQAVEESTESEQSDSDTDLEMEIVQALLKRGKEKFEAKDLEAAERLFRNCLSRISSNISTLSLHHIPRPKYEIMTLLLNVYVAQGNWNEAQSLLLEKIAAGSRDKSGNNGLVLIDMLTLVNILIQKGSYTEALLYGRRALKGYRKMGSDGAEGVESSLKSLVHVCHLNGNYDEEDAYAAILSDFLHLNASKRNTSAATITEGQHTTPPSTPLKSPVAPQEKSIHSTIKQQTNLFNSKWSPSMESQEDIVEDQTSLLLESRTNFQKDDRTELHPFLVPSPLPYRKSLQLTSTEDETLGCLSERVFEEKVFRSMPSPNLDAKPVKMDQVFSPRGTISGMFQHPSN